MGRRRECVFKMLQPLQLKEVSARYPNEIAELRDFLVKADCVPGTEESLHTIADRLQRDRAFHRDLTLHLWVVIHLSNRTISYADLLGMLAIAAAGAHFAAQTHEDDAHALLRFVMEARHSLDGTGTQEHTPAVYPSAPLVEAQPRPVLPEVVREQEILPSQTHPSPVEFLSRESEEAGGSRRRLLWIAACVLITFSIGLALHYRTAPDKGASPPPAATNAMETPAPVASEGDAAPSLRSEATPAVNTHSAIEKQSAHMKPLALQARNAYEPSATKSSVPGYPPALPPAITTTVLSKAPPVVTSLTAPTPLPPARSLPAVPSTTALRSPSTSADSSAPDLTNTFRGASVPRLVRRSPEERAELTADRQPPAATPNTPSGTVRAITLGVSASRVLYSPTPAYPPAASAAHVQGEVKLQADVDRDGNVASVRVISGPSLLREAALDAAQRWRYRPNMAAGEPTSMSAITVFAFQLP